MYVLFRSVKHNSALLIFFAVISQQSHQIRVMIKVRNTVKSCIEVQTNMLEHS